jgi:hypothetical protein
MLTDEKRTLFRTIMISVKITVMGREIKLNSQDSKKYLGIYRDRAQEIYSQNMASWYIEYVKLRESET